MNEPVVMEEVVVTARRGGRPVAWRPRVVRGGKTRDASQEDETRIVRRALAVGLALVLMLELHIRAIEAPASVPHEVARAYRHAASGAMNR
jgi:hypothetical protein